ncbi:MAG: SAM-dependent methyltransferase [Thermoprotei archaeon]|nr:MAG: SAM-dependent methyltransferase [Thermoprotei archaeon]
MSAVTIVKYEFKSKPVVVLDSSSSSEILEKLRQATRFEVTVNLGLRRSIVELRGSEVVIDGSYHVELEDLENIAGDPEDLYAVQGFELKKLVIASSHFYRLRRVAPNAAPTLEIDGIHMHRVEGVTPWIDAKTKVSLARVGRGDFVLDTCMGLGYTAIHSSIRGAKVLTVEVDPNVVEMASYNPWSRGLEDPRVETVMGDICDVVKELGSEHFTKVIHDPPRFSARTGSLYGRELYQELYRVLRPRGVLFHYVGSPGRIRGLDLAKGVAKRLVEVGFDVKMLRRAEAVLAIKPP